MAGEAKDDPVPLIGAGVVFAVLGASRGRTDADD